MRILSFVIVLFFSAGIFGQSPAAYSSFTDGAKSAASGDFENALKSYRTSLMLVENEASKTVFKAKLHFNIGVCLYRLNRSAEAVPEFEEAIRLRKGKYQKAAYALGMAESARENWVNAGEAFESAVKLKEDDGEAWFDLGMTHIARSDFSKAEKAFRTSIIYKTVDSALSHNNVGVILAMKNDFPRAEQEFEKALFLSAGRLIEARNNLEYCKKRTARDLVAGLSFSARDELIGNY